MRKSNIVRINVVLNVVDARKRKFSEIDSGRFLSAFDRRNTVHVYFSWCADL